MYERPAISDPIKPIRDLLDGAVAEVEGGRFLASEIVGDATSGYHVAILRSQRFNQPFITRYSVDARQPGNLYYSVIPIDRYMPPYFHVSDRLLDLIEGSGHRGRYVGAWIRVCRRVNEEARSIETSIEPGDLVVCRSAPAAGVAFSLMGKTLRCERRVLDRIGFSVVDDGADGVSDPVVLEGYAGGFRKAAEKPNSDRRIHRLLRAQRGDRPEIDPIYPRGRYYDLPSIVLTDACPSFPFFESLSPGAISRNSDIERSLIDDDRFLTFSLYEKSQGRWRKAGSIGSLTEGYGYSLATMSPAKRRLRRPVSFSGGVRFDFAFGLGPSGEAVLADVRSSIEHPTGRVLEEFEKAILFLEANLNMPDFEPAYDLQLPRVFGYEKHFERSLNGPRPVYRARLRGRVDLPDCKPGSYPEAI